VVQHGLAELALLRLDSRPLHTEAIGVQADRLGKIEIALPQQEAVGSIA
jgi:hypothetical protein